MLQGRVFLFLFCIPFFCLIQGVHAPFYFDDFPVLIDYEAIRSFTWENILVYLGPRFIPYLTFSVNYQINHTDTFFFHLFNFFLHIANGLLLYALIKKLLILIEEEEEKSSFIALLSAFLFVMHPVQSQATIYIVQRSELFAAFFYFSALLYFVHIREFFEKNVQTETFWKRFFSFPHLSRYFVLLFLILCAFLSKEVSVTLPVALLLIDFFFLGKNFKKGLLYLSPLLCLLVAVPFFMFMQYGVVREGFLVKLYGAPELSTYLLTEIHVFFTYLRLLFFPFNLHLDYDYPSVDEVNLITILFFFLF